MSDTIEFGEREWKLAYRVALRVLKAPDQAEDAAQEALMNAYAARDKFRGQARPDSWLYRIAYNTALSHLRKPFVRRYTSADVHETIDSGTSRPLSERCPSSPERAALASELAGHLELCLSGLGTNDRVAFTERFLHGSSERELGELLGLTTNAAKQRAFRARRKVRAYIQEVGLAPAA